MPRVILAFLFGCAYILTPSVAGTAATTTSLASAATQRAIVAAVERDRKLYGGRTPVPGVIIGVWDGKDGSFVRTFGYADVAKRTPLTFTDHFRIASNTKTFVVAVILQLADEHKLSLDDSVSRFNLGVTIPNGQNITIRELCNMRSGLFESTDTPQVARIKPSEAAKLEPRTQIEWALQQKPYSSPGRAYHYSNTNYLLLGSIVESVTRDSVANQIRKRFLVPFNLTQTSYPVTQAMPDPWARGYGLGKQRNWEDVSGTVPVSLMGAAGAMISDASDMRRWIRLYVTGKTSSPAMHRALMDCVPTGEPGVGFGLALGCGAGWYGYTGTMPGYNTSEFYFPQTGATIVAWVNAESDNPVPGVANAIFRDIARILTPNNDPLPEGSKGL
ncbi:MAG: serine hydrolase domain-containing protein [Candidatus Cybelea sp.]